MDEYTWTKSEFIYLHLKILDMCHLIQHFPDSLEPCRGTAAAPYLHIPVFHFSTYYQIIV